MFLSSQGKSCLLLKVSEFLHRARKASGCSYRGLVFQLVGLWAEMEPVGGVRAGGENVLGRSLILARRSD